MDGQDMIAEDGVIIVTLITNKRILLNLSKNKFNY
jgi:hypothetical protein